MQYLLGFDAGTTCFKCALYDTAGTAIAFDSKEYTLLSPKPGFVEYPPEEYFGMLVSLIKSVTEKSCVSPKDIVAMSISSQGETLITVDKDGNPTRNAIVWLDNRSTAETAQLKAKFALREVYEASGQCEIVPTWTATKILWLKNNEPEMFRKADKFLLLEDYLLYRLTGEYVTERSLQCSSMLYDIRTKTWWRDILDYIGISETQLPALLNPGDSIGHISKTMASQLGLSEETLVVAGALDQVCAVIGSGNAENGSIVESTGSCLAVCAAADSVPQYRPGVRITCQHHAIKDKYILLFFTQTAGMVYKWLKERLYAAEAEKCAGTGKDIFALMDKEAARVPAGSKGLIVLPNWEGAQYPEYNSDAKGVMYGLTLAHGRPEIARAVLEAVAYTLHTIILDLETMGVSAPSISSNGGGAKSELWCEIKAAVTGKTIYTSDISQPANLGAAILAGIGVGIYPSVSEAVSRVVKSRREYKPRTEWADVYKSGYKEFQKLYKLLLPMCA